MTSSICSVNNEVIIRYLRTVFVKQVFILIFCCCWKRYDKYLKVCRLKDEEYDYCWLYFNWNEFLASGVPTQLKISNKGYDLWNAIKGVTCWHLRTYHERMVFEKHNFGRKVLNSFSFKPVKATFKKTSLKSEVKSLLDKKQKNNWQRL